MSEKAGPRIERYRGFKKADSYKEFVTAGDLGGTKERLALYGRDKRGNIEIIIRVSWFYKDVKSIADIFVEYHRILKKRGLRRPKRAVLGCAGPIEDGGRYCRLTNINLEVSTAELEKLGLSVELINDFFANAQQIPCLKKKERQKIRHNCKPENHDAKKKSKNRKCRTKVVLGPGSGLGVAPVFWDEEKKAYYSQPSEGGHKAWSPRNDLEWSLYNYLKDHVADGRDPDVELVASGKGLTNIVRFLCYGNLPKGTTPEEIEALRETQDFRCFVESLKKEKAQNAGRTIIEAYDDGKYTVALECAIQIFVDAVAAAARDAVHDFCAYGGVYVSGGNARRLKEHFLSERFMEVFDLSYEHRDKLRQTPVYLVTSKTLGTDGAARYAFSKM